MTNPFENPNGTYLVLINDERQHSVWPETVEVPAGWTVVKPGGTREDALAYIEENWTDMRPASLVKAMADTAS
ncbi:MbtH family protein [Streptomyces sp. NPDC059917]|uniref:MbtH family protein n=1 Tax=Streptomyces sp. NPDC059917 TaxID=3347002 RepID=UPI0036570055